MLPRDLLILSDKAATMLPARADVVHWRFCSLGCHLCLRMRSRGWLPACCQPGADRLWLCFCSLVLSQKGDVRGRKAEKDTARFGMDLKHCDLQVTSWGT